MLPCQLKNKERKKNKNETGEIHFREDVVDSFSWSSCQVNLKTLDIIHKTNIRRLWVIERRGQNSQGPQDPRNNIVVSSLDFIFDSSIQNLERKKPATQRHQLVQTREASTKACSLQPKDQESSSLGGQKALGQYYFALVRHHTNSHPCT